MSSTKITYQEVYALNGAIVRYLTKTGILSDKLTRTNKEDPTKLDLALTEILYKQITKKIDPKFNKDCRDIIIKNALTDPTTKELLILDKAVNAGSLQLPTVYKYSDIGQLQMDDELYQLRHEGKKWNAVNKSYEETGKYEIHKRSIPEVDMPALTEEEKEDLLPFIDIEKAAP